MFYRIPEIHPQYFVKTFEERCAIIKYNNNLLNKYILMSIKLNNINKLKIKIKSNNQTDSQFIQINVQ